MVLAAAAGGRVGVHAGGRAAVREFRQAGMAAGESGGRVWRRGTRESDQDEWPPASCLLGGAVGLSRKKQLLDWSFEMEMRRFDSSVGASQ